MTNQAQTAKAAQQVHIEIVEAKIARITQWLAEEKNVEHVNWGDVGSVGYVSEELDKILSFLGK